MKIVLNKLVVIFFITFLCLSCTPKRDYSKLTDPQKDGYVPNEETAIKIAEAVWLPIYGKEIYKEKPFHATLKNDTIWVVEGTLKKEADGGTVYAEIHKGNGKILKVTHYK